MLQRYIKNNASLYSITILFITAIYAITGYIGFLFAAPSGATAIWIPSGIALGAALIWGIRILPGIFLGSFIINYVVVSLRFEENHILFIPFILAIGATLQVLLGWYFIKKWVGTNNILIQPNDILLFALISGPLSCLVNTTWSNTALYLFHVLPLHSYFVNWITWWVGDSMGVLIFTPAFLILFAHPKTIWRQRIFPILLPLFTSFFIIALVYLFARSAAPSVKYINAEFSWQLWSTLTSGLLFCAFINIILFIIHGQKYLAQIGFNEKSAALKFSESKNSLILQSAGEGIYGIDNNGIATFINPAAAKLLGYQENELIGKSMHELIHHHYADGSIYLREECPVHSSSNNKTSCRAMNEVFWRKDGTSFWAEYTSTPLINGNGSNGAVVVFNDVTERHKFETELERMVHHDFLTSLPNRMSFLEQLSIKMDLAKQHHQKLAVCIIDIDNFKQINDSLGHHIGDETLKNVAQLFKHSLNKSDYLSRLSGDEFGIIIENIKSEDEIRITLDRILETFQKPLQISHVEIHISLSSGIAIYPIAGEKSEELLTNANIAMHHTKKYVKGTYGFFDSEINNEVKRQNKIDMKMRHALSNNEFSLHYQVQIDANTQTLLGIEPLLRWHDKELGDISPSEFIPIAETNGLIQIIGEWVFKQSFQDHKKILSACNDDKLILSVNVSAVQLENINFLKTLTSALEETGMQGSNLLIEITETALINNPKYTLNIISEIMKLGIHFALDDFGVSYSSMQYLKNLPVSLIKIDQGFIADMLTNDNDVKIVNAIIQLSHSMNIYTLAEGVENEKQFNLLKKMGCEYMQGYFFAKPMPLSDLLNHSIIKNNKIKS